MFQGLVCRVLLLGLDGSRAVRDAHRRMGGLPRPGGGLRQAADTVYSGTDHRHSGNGNEAQLGRAQAAGSRLGSNGSSRSALGCCPGTGGGGSTSSSRSGLTGACQHILENLPIWQLGRLGLLRTHKPQQEGNGRQTVELGPLLLQVPDLGLNLPAAVQQTAFYRTFRRPQSCSNVLYRHLLVVVHTDNCPLVLRQSIDDLTNQPGGLRPVQHLIGEVSGIEIGKMLLHRLIRLLSGGQVGKEHGLLLFQIVPGRVGPDLPHPG